MTASRLKTGGRINREETITLTFDGRPLSAFQGDTLASALLVNNETVVARSFKYHRPRGIFSAGIEEPNAMIQLGDGSRTEPNTPATMISAYDGLQSFGQNAWPNVRVDFNSVNQLFAPFMSSGFYYKTFIGPFKGTRFWMFCESVIRRAAGMGQAVIIDDPDCYEKKNAFCDVLIIGAGPAGLAAALSSGRSGLNVFLVEQDEALGGSLLSSPAGTETDDWLKGVIEEINLLGNVKILTRSTVFGAYDQDIYGVIEKLWDHVSEPPADQPRQCYWRVRTKQAILATGAIERPLVFGNNDKPGVMLVNSVRTYINRYAVLPSQQVIISTNNDSAYSTAFDLVKSGAIVTLLDMRTDIPKQLLELVKTHGIELFSGYAVLAAKGRRCVSSAIITAIDAKGRAAGEPRTLPCDLIAVSGGWSPVLHLWSQRQQKPVFESEKGCFVPVPDSLPTMKCAGSVLAVDDLKQTVSQGFAAGIAAAETVAGAYENGDEPIVPEPQYADGWGRDYCPLWCVTDSTGKTLGKAFIDLQHDVTRSDIDLAHREGYVSVEHLKRYTTLGMATDQGTLSNINAMSRMAELRNATIPDVGTTTFRPPYTPVTIGSLVGAETGLHFAPTRLTPMHDWHEKHGAVQMDVGAWKRPRYYPENGESLRDSYIRESAHVRNGVGMVDVSTLGKIAVQGPDAAEFLNRIYVNGWKLLEVGRIRYGVMLREDGFIMDDGVTARLGEFDYFMSTTTANAAKVLALSELLLQTSWKDLKVHVTTITDQWAAIAVAGPRSRELLTRATTGADLTNETLPNNYLTHADMSGVNIRIQRMSYSGELAYEIYIPAGYGFHIWEYLMQVGDEFNLRPYGTEAMGALRIEKGHVAGPEIEGRTTLKDIGMDGFASKKKPFIGSILKNRPFLTDPVRPSLVGLEVEGGQDILAGSLLFSEMDEAKGHGDGWVSSTTYSAALKKNIALALLKNGTERKGEKIRVIDFLSDTTLTAKVVSPHFFDPKGERQNA